MVRKAAAHYQHPLALVESARIGAGTRIWAFAHVMKGAHIGRDCNIGDHAFV
ncbi:MAG: N-acetyltransferase, partial [Acidobacteria bacterium]